VPSNCDARQRIFARQDRFGCIVDLAGIDGFKGVEFNGQLPT